MPRPVPRRPLAAVLLAASLVLTAGCSSGARKLPPMHPVEGKIVYKGGRPLAGGSVNFQSQADPTLATSADVQPDGSFSLSTFADKERLKGAPAGKYNVTVIPAMGSDHSIQPISLPKPYEVEAKENRFTITLDRAAPKQ